MTTVINAPGEVFADPTVDFAFKRIFGTEKYKEATIGLLNSLITGRRIRDVKFLNVEIPGETADSRKAFIDVLCTDADDGSLFICEMQNNRQTYFRERMVYYSSKVISSVLGDRGDWDFSMAPTYVVAITNFSFPEEVREMDSRGRNILHYVTREETAHTKMPGSTEYFFLDIRSFDKKLEEVTDEREKWIYLLSNSSRMTDVPEEFACEASFRCYFDASVRAGFTKEENLRYTKDMMLKQDILNSRRQAEARARAEGREEGKIEGRQEGLAEGEAKGREEGLTEGLEKGKIAIARNLKAMGLSPEDIAKATGLTTAELAVL